MAVNEAPETLRKAVEMLRQFHPYISVALFLPDGSWRYFERDPEDGSYDMPEFKRREVDVSLLEDAQAAVEEKFALPVVFLF